MIDWQKLEAEISKYDGWEIVYRYETEGYKNMTEYQIGYNDIAAAYAIVKTPQNHGIDNLLVWGYFPNRGVWVNAVKPGMLITHLLKAECSDCGRV